MSVEIEALDLDRRTRPPQIVGKGQGRADRNGLVATSVEQQEGQVAPRQTSIDLAAAGRQYGGPDRPPGCSGG